MHAHRFTQKLLHTSLGKHGLNEELGKARETKFAMILSWNILQGSACKLKKENGMGFAWKTTGQHPVPKIDYNYLLDFIIL